MGSQKRCYEASVVVPLTVLAHWEAVDGRARQGQAGGLSVMWDVSGPCPQPAQSQWYARSQSQSQW